MTARTLEDVLQLSTGLHSELVEIFGHAKFADSERATACLVSCDISREHGASLIYLMAAGNFTSAISLLRLQFEALVRSVWLYYAAADEDVTRIMADLSLRSEKDASTLPSTSLMLRALEGKAPAAACQMLGQVRDANLKSLHSFVHSGIHALKRTQTGYPESLLTQIVRNSNALLVLASMMLGTLAPYATLLAQVRTLRHSFAACLPEIVEG